MKTDIPLKRVTMLCGSDIASLIDDPTSELIAVETLELPASATRLDNVLYMRSAQGQEYIHVIEWLAYDDETGLWRFVGYLAWVGQKNPGKVVIGTLIYLTPNSDLGDALIQEIDGKVVHSCPIHCVRVWLLDAHKAIGSKKVGLAVISPLMHNATKETVEEAITLIQQETTMPQQAELLSTLGIFAERLMPAEEFIQKVGRNNLMESALIQYFVDDALKKNKEEMEVQQRSALETQKVEFEAQKVEFEAQKQAILENQLAQMEGKQVSSLQQTLTLALVRRFPQAPAALVQDIWQITNPEQLYAMIVELAAATNVSEFEQALKHANGV